MDIKQIQELIKLVNKTGISELKIKEGDTSITIKNQSGVMVSPVIQPTVMQTAVATSADAGTSSTENTKSESTTAANQYIFKSPMIGTFYRKSGPDKPPFVNVGDTIKNGDVLCIIEAMKLFNEIEFDGGSGKIVKVLADDSAPVEYDQPLFLIEKTA